MRALEELPNNTKDAMLPIVHIRPWATAFLLQNGLERLAEAYGDRPTVIAMSEPEPVSRLRPVHGELDDLRLADDGYINWCAFIEEHANYIPAVQLRDPAHIGQQISRFYELDRGIVFIVERVALGGLQALATAVSGLTGGGQDTCFVLDLGIGSRDPLQLAVFVAAYCRAIQQACPFAAVSISASSFPMDFTTIVEQEIYERTLFNAVRENVGPRGLVYSDRGSARVERQRGGGGQPAPRIDYPLSNQWLFYRNETRGLLGYQAEAVNLIGDDAVFDRDLRVWGTLMIERTAAGDTSAITNPARSTAARINLHLQRQTFFDDPTGLYDTEDPWNG